MNRGWSIKSTNKITYTIININDSTKEKVCIQSDKENEKKYRLFCDKATTTSKKWENSGAKMNLEVPKPPKPNNYEKLMEFKRRNVLRPAIEQSMATIFLLKYGYKLEEDYEAYQAIDLAKSLKSYIETEEKKKRINRRSRVNTLINLNKGIDNNTNKLKEDNLYPSINSSDDESLSNSLEFLNHNNMTESLKENNNYQCSVEQNFKFNKNLKNNFINKKKYETLLNNPAPTAPPFDDDIDNEFTSF